MSLHSPSADRNKQAILDTLRPSLERIETVLEIGSGTGQHAEFFSRSIPSLTWQTSDQGAYFNELKTHTDAMPNWTLPTPIEIDVNTANWHNLCAKYDAIYSANTLHIMDKVTSANFLNNISNSLNKSGYVFLYGPFKYKGEFTSESNAAFDESLRARQFGDGIKDFEWVATLLIEQGLTLIEDVCMPANNQLLIWQSR